MNSGSSANLVAISALIPQIAGSRRIQPGDGDHCGCWFPPQWLNRTGELYLFIDADPSQAMPAVRVGTGLQLEKQSCNDGPCPGNPFDLATTLAFCHKYNLRLKRTTATHWAVVIPCLGMAESLGFQKQPWPR